MTGLQIHLDGDGAWPDLAEKLRAKKLHHAHIASVAMLASGTGGGKPSVAVRIDLADGTSVLAETTLELFLAAARAFEARASMPDRKGGVA